MTNITRRDFLKVTAAGTGTLILAGCGGSTERWVKLEPYVLAPEDQVAGIPNWYATTCRQCPAGCGILVRVMNGRATKIEGNPEHPVNRGKTCARGQAGLQFLYNPDRVTGAVKHAQRGDRKFEPIPWNEGINTLYEKLNAAGDKVAVWVGSTTSGHLYDLFHRFTEAISAPAPVRYDLYTGLHGYKALTSASDQLFQRAELPVYDIANADAVFSFGADFLGTWLNSTGYNYAYGQFRSQPYGQRGYLVQFEPRMSTTAAVADHWVPIQPGSETLVAQAIARIIADEGLGGDERAQRAQSLAGEVDLAAAASACGLPAEEFARLARAFGSAERPLAIPGSALGGQNNAAQAVAAVQVLNIIAGNIGQPGGMSFVDAPPEAQLAASPVSSLGDVQDLLQRMNAGEVEVLLVHGANPAYELPPDAKFVDAVKNVPLVVSFNPLVDETALWADLILPDRIYLEGWGYEVVTPAIGGLPVVGSQQPVVPPLYDVRATGDVLLTVAQGLPGAAQALPWTDEVAFIQETITALPAGASGGEDNEVRWARFQQHGGWWAASAPTQAAPEARLTAPVEVGPVQFQGDEAEYPYFLYPYMSVMLGDGRGASLPWLQGAPDPMTTIAWQTWVEINPETAKKLKLDNGDIVRLTSPHGELEAPVYVYPAIRPDTVAIPVGQGHSDSGRYARGRGSSPVQLVSLSAAEGAENLGWSTLRVKIEKTGDHKALAVFETTVDQAKDMPLPF